MKGTYALIIELKSDKRIRIGKLGMFKFGKGFYVYVGSAINGVEKRVARHRSSKKKTHWHIDYLLGYSEVKEAFAVRGEHEAELAQKMLEHGKVVADGFGSSDTNVSSHLTFFEKYPKNVLMREMSKFGTVVLL